MSEKQEKLKILKDILGGFQRSGNEYFFYCPSCEYDKKKLSINLSKGFFHCWKCGFAGKSIYRIVKRFGKDGHKFKWKAFESQVDLSAFDEKLFPTDKTFEVINQKIDLPNDFVSLTSKKIWNKNLTPVKYLKDRGIVYQDVLDWRLGFSPRDSKYGERIIVPSFGVNGHINYFVGRTYTNHPWKYVNADVPNNIVFNHLHIDWDEDVHLVEGPFDAFKAGTNSIPLLGSSLKENSLLFKEIVRHDARVFLALDPDAQDKQFRLINKLLEYDIELYEIVIPEDEEDVGKMSKEDFLEYKKQAQKVDRTNVFQYNIMNKLRRVNL